MSDNKHAPPTAYSVSQVMPSPASPADGSSRVVDSLGTAGESMRILVSFQRNRENVIYDSLYPSNRKIDWGCRFACASIAVPVWTRMVLLVKLTISSAISASLMRDSAAPGCLIGGHKALRGHLTACCNRPRGRRAAWKAAATPNPSCLSYVGHREARRVGYTSLTVPSLNLNDWAVIVPM